MLRLLSHRRTAAQAAALAAALTLLGPGARRSLQAQPGQPVLHEPLPPAVAAQGRSDQLEMSRADRQASNAPGEGALPEAILTSQGRIAQPPPAKAGDGVPTYGPRQPPRVGIDRRTGADLELHYQVVFDPAIAPFKRDFSFDRVSSALTLEMSGAGLREISANHPPRADHELFWGHAKLRLQAGQKVLLPSVAPTSQILAWQALPPLPLQFFRDDAGNYSAMAASDGEVDLRFLMDAPSNYFAAPLGRGAPKPAPGAPATPTLDPALQRRAEALWPQLGLTARADPAETVGKLVAWFRAFAPATGEPPPPAPGSDALAELVLAQKGVCRHRALGLLVMAHSLGIPAHYVMNEAHAFVEVWVPLATGGSGWQRVDLGGGAESLELHAAQDKRLHRPLYSDPFERPKAYTDQVGRVSVDGQTVDQAFGGAAELKGAEGLRGAEVGAGPPQAADSAGSTPPGQPGGQGSEGGRGGDEAAARRQWLQQRAQGLAPRPTPPLLSPRPGAADPGRAEDATRLPTSLRLDPLQPTGWVGEAIRVSGQLSAGAAAPRLPVEVWLIDPARPTEGRLLGTAPTDSAGRFAAELALPADALPRTYDVVARFAGDPRRAPSDSGP